MRSLLLLGVALVPVLTLLGVVTLALVLVRRARPATGATSGEGRRRLFRFFGLAAGVVAAVAVGATDDLGRGVLLAAPVAAFGVLLGLLAAELSVRPPSGPRRVASLTTRRAADYLPRRLTALVAGTGVGLAVLTAVGTALGSPDDLGRAGRFLTVQCSAEQVASRGPWPGAYYTVPLAVVVVLGVALALAVLHVTVARPPVPVDPALGNEGVARAEAWDADLRRRAASSVVAGLGLLLGVPLAGTSFFAGSAVAGLAGCAPTWWGPAGVALLVLSLVAAAVVLRCAWVVLLDGRTAASQPVPAERP